jgi:hypothetical protein
MNAGVPATHWRSMGDDGSEMRGDEEKPMFANSADYNPWNVQEEPI